MYKKKVFFILIIFFIVFSIISEDLYDNEDYKKAVELLSLAKQEYERGDYDKGYEYSEEAKKYLILANQFNIIRILIIDANRERDRAKEAMELAKEFGAENNNTAKEYYEKAVNYFDEATNYFNKGNDETEYETRVETYKNAIAKYQESTDMSYMAFSKLPEARKYANDLLRKAKEKRRLLINLQTIYNNDDDDMIIKEDIKGGEDAFNSKDYYTSIKKSNEAIDYMDKLNRKNEAKDMLAKAKDKLDKSKKLGAGDDFPDKVNRADELIKKAEDTYNNKEFDDSIDYSMQVLNIIDSFGYKDYAAFPKYYKVRLIPNNRDCFWKISRYKFIYNDKNKWKILYDANKDKLRYPTNPNLIYPDMIIEIPSINGEEREGYFDPDIDYEPFNPKKDYSD